MKQVRSAILAAVSVAAVVLSGCVGDGDAEWNGTWTIKDQGIRIDAAPGALSTITSGGAEAFVKLPEYSLVKDGSRFVWQDGVEVFAGDRIEFLPPPFRDEMTFEIGGTVHTVTVDRGDHDRFLDGMNIIDALRYQQWHFPDRDLASGTLVPAFTWGAEAFAELGYEVELDPYGFYDVPEPLAAGCSAPSVFIVGTSRICPYAYSNVVATKAGATPGAEIIVMGGHYDLVPQTTHGAWDNTGGSVAVIEVARALADIDTELELKFALWGGEENGLLGSQFWVRSNLDLHDRMHSYVNSDVVGLHWPAPVSGPFPIEIAAGPDTDCAHGFGPASTREPLCSVIPEAPAALEVIAFAEMVLGDWVGVPDDMFYGVGEYHRTTPGGSDHRAFMEFGIPALALWSPHINDGPVKLHTDLDTLQNMSKEALWGFEYDIESEGWLDPADRLAGEEALARSFEPFLWYTFYHIMLSDFGLWDPPDPPESLLPV